MAFPTSYKGVTFASFRHYAPYNPIEFQPNGVNAIFATVDNATFTFAERVFMGAWFSITIVSPEIINPPGDELYFELYHQGMLVHTSAALTPGNTGQTYLASGHAGLVDEVRVRSTGAMQYGNPGSHVWTMDDIEFDPGI